MNIGFQLTHESGFCLGDVEIIGWRFYEDGKVIEEQPVATTTMREAAELRNKFETRVKEMF